jgi:glucose/arabinose dehydrogenase
VRMGPWRARAVPATLVAAALLCATPAHAAPTLPTGFASNTLASGLTNPVAVAWTPDGRMLIAIKEGLVRVVDPDGTLEPDPIIDISSQVNAYHDRGMLGIAVDAGYATNHYIYLLYTHETNAADFTGPKVSQLLRVVLNPDNTVGAQKVILGTVETTPCPDPPRQHGGLHSLRRGLALDRHGPDGP